MQLPNVKIQTALYTLGCLFSMIISLLIIDAEVLFLYYYTKYFEKLGVC